MAIPSLTGIQVELGLARVAGDAGLYRSLLLNLARHGENTLAELESALHEQDVARLGLLAHRLKGVSGNLGAADLEEWAARLEQLAGLPFSAATQDCQNGLRACLQELSQEILEQFQGSAAQRAPSSQSIRLDDQLQKLLNELDNCDGQALDTWLELVVGLQDRLLPEEIAALDQLIQDFDFAPARRALLEKLI